jgi:hypothetical protein
MKEDHNESELDALIDACLDGRLSNEEADRLSKWIEDSSDARQRYWELASVHGMIEQSMQNASLKAVTGEAAVTPMTPKRLSRWPRVSAVAAGMVIGILSTTAVFGIVVPRVTEVRPTLISVMRDAFEDPGQTFQRGIARYANEWFYHGKVEVVRSDNPEPVSGEHVLKLSPNPERKKGQVHYLIDLHDYPEVMKSGDRSIQVGGFFYTSGEGGGEYVIRIGAFAEPPEQVGVIWAKPSEIQDRALQQISRQSLKNEEQVGWQELMTDMSLPEGTRTVIVGIMASHDHDDPNYRNRYLDAVSMQFVLDYPDATSMGSE